MRKVRLPESIKGGLFLHGMPGTKEVWPDFLIEAQKEGVDYILSLTSMDEIKVNSPEYANAILNKNLNINRIELPIKDFDVPRNINIFKQCIKTTADSLLKGKIILIHCLGGIGRTGLAANCFLQALGIEPNDAEDRVKQAGSGAETQAQLDFINSFIP